MPDKKAKAPRMSKRLQEAVQEVMSIMLAEHHPHTNLTMTAHQAVLTEDSHSIINNCAHRPEPQGDSDLGNGLNEDDMNFGVTTG